MMMDMYSNWSEPQWELGRSDPYLGWVTKMVAAMADSDPPLSPLFADLSLTPSPLFCVLFNQLNFLFSMIHT